MKPVVEWANPVGWLGRLCGNAGLMRVAASLGPTLRARPTLAPYEPRLDWQLSGLELPQLRVGPGLLRPELLARLGCRDFGVQWSRPLGLGLLLSGPMPSTRVLVDEPGPPA